MNTAFQPQDFKYWLVTTNIGWVNTVKQLLGENEHAVYNKYVSAVSDLSGCMFTEWQISISMQS
jgi:hypothetical protein